MTRFLSVQEVIGLHDAETSAPLLDRGELEGAVGQPEQTVEGVYLHPTVLEQAAVLLRGVCQAHAFLDGNKRAAWLAAVTFLDLNGVQLVPLRVDDAEKLVLNVATGAANVADVTLWLAERT